MCRVSIIIPCHNNENEILNSINSCLQQTEKNIEIIVVDNGSSDNDETKNIINEINDARIIYIKEKEANRSKARNIGISQAKGKYLQFLDADDALKKDKLKKSCDFLDKNYKYSAYMTMTDYKNKKRVISTEGKLRTNLTVQNTMPINAIVIKNKDIHLFNEKLMRCEDWLFWVENLMYKKVLFNEYYSGCVVNVTNSGTMRNYRNMVKSELEVRAIIEDKYGLKTLTLKNMKYRLIELVELVYWDDLDFDMKSRYRASELLAKLLLNTPFLKNKIIKKIKALEYENKYFK